MSIAAVASKVRTALAAFSLVALVGCGSIDGNFDYPDEPANPGTANVLLVDKGWDNDSPLRARIEVIDIGNSSAGALLNFYRATYGSAGGWAQLKVDGRHQEICLVRRSDSRYSEFVEVFPYKGSRVAAEPGRHLVMISRLEPGDEETSCGFATAWIPSDLLEAYDVSPPAG